jgi:hypothetical protein
MMGFTMVITINVNINPKNGFPFIWYNNNGAIDKKPYIPEEHEIPEMYRRFIELQGHHFRAYIYPFEKVDQVGVDDFLEYYPEWEFVKTENGLTSEFKYWTQEDHNLFRCALQWMCSNSLVSAFSISWSY